MFNKIIWKIIKFLIFNRIGKKIRCMYDGGTKNIMLWPWYDENNNYIGIAFCTKGNQTKIKSVDVVKIITSDNSSYETTQSEIASSKSAKADFS